MQEASYWAQTTQSHLATLIPSLPTYTTLRKEIISSRVGGDTLSCISKMFLRDVTMSSTKIPRSHHR